MTRKRTDPKGSAVFMETMKRMPTKKELMAWWMWHETDDASDGLCLRDSSVKGYIEFLDKFDDFESLREKHDTLWHLHSAFQHQFCPAPTPISYE